MSDQQPQTSSESLAADGVIESHLSVSNGEASAVDLLASETGLSRSAIKQVMQSGAVWLTRGAHSRRLRRAKSKLQEGDELHLYYNPELLNSEPPNAQLIADEGDYSVWYKPAGMFTQGTKWGDSHSIVRWAEQHIKPERTAKLVHRLDRHTSGLILLAHSKKAAAALSGLFASRDIKKSYEALVVGEIGPVGWEQRVEEPVDEKPAASVVTVLANAHGCSHVGVAIETGRRHQIRCHLSGLGFAIVGDRLYGQDHPTGMHLAAVDLAFCCPLTQEPRHYSLEPALRPSFYAINEPFSQVITKSGEEVGDL